DRVEVGQDHVGGPARRQPHDGGADARRALGRDEADDGHPATTKLRSRSVSVTATPRSTSDMPILLLPAALTIASATSRGTSSVALEDAGSRPPPIRPTPPVATGVLSTRASASGCPVFSPTPMRMTRTRSPESTPSGTRPSTIGTPTSASR